MSKGKKAKAEEQSRLRRSIDARKRKKRIALLVDEIMIGSEIWLSNMGDDPEEDEGLEEEEEGFDDEDEVDVLEGVRVEDGDDGTTTYAGTIRETPGNRDSLARLGRMIDDAGGTLEFGPDQVSLVGDEVDDEDDGYELVMDEEYLADPLFDEAVMAAMPRLVAGMGDKAFAYHAYLVDMACRTVVVASGGELIHEDDALGDDGELVAGATEHECELFAVPFSGPAKSVRRALVTLCDGPAIGDRMRACGVVDPGSVIRFISGVLPLDALQAQAVRGIRLALESCLADALGVGDAADRIAPGALADALGFVDACEAFGSGEAYVAGAIVGVRVMEEREDGSFDWLVGGEVGPDGTDPGDVWAEWCREAFAASGVEVSTPMGIAQASSEAAQMLVEVAFGRQIREQGIGPGVEPDRTVLCRADHVSAFLWYEGASRIVGPLDIPLMPVIADTLGFMDVLQSVGGGELVLPDDRQEYDALLSSCRETAAAARRREESASGAAQGWQGTVAPEVPPADEVPPSSGGNVTAFPSGDVIPFRRRTDA